ncbi:hypothetical protein [Blautia stercoris]
MYAPYPENMMESVKKVEATRAERMATEPRRLSADEKDALLKSSIRIIETRSICRNQSWTKQRTEGTVKSWHTDYIPIAVF